MTARDGGRYLAARGHDGESCRDIADNAPARRRDAAAEFGIVGRAIGSVGRVYPRAGALALVCLSISIPRR
jgi:hypothetical protein